MNRCKERRTLWLLSIPFCLWLTIASPIRAAQYTITDLGTVGGTSTLALGVNSVAQVTGYSYIADNSEPHPFLYSGGVMTDLGTFGGNDSRGGGDQQYRLRRRFLALPQ